ncbi:DUF6290 family protein [Enterococcus cecorum]|uniref:DUF6290 family protein n=1 Tax=Enterococcus cecorum TaxID=44008 RepID=UPI001FAD3FDA|nr:DUF6290 family protein [Enterococcus cecorum]MCJ0538329.1 DUF6290 family protein [Enterococcus cecorum]MCJ0546423.1 DUF6290 family protein [Enterococcus cecorum]MCJ0550726.1 DUF6290 family protein [Enterococcus cecorum]MCJ0569966.1 DUF6290 family protein [Enterococcus cecorum]
MHTISFHVSDEEAKLIKDYLTVNCLNLPEFIKEAIFEKMEEDLVMDEQRIQAAREKAKSERRYDHTEVWKRLEI